MRLDAQEVLQRKHHLNKIDLVVKPWQVETLQESCQVKNSEGSLLPTAVVLENVKETTKDCMLTMLVENISGLSEDDGDFSVEMIPELCAAVVTFTGNTGKEEPELNLFLISYMFACVCVRLSWEYLLSYFHIFDLILCPFKGGFTLLKLMP